MATMAGLSSSSSSSAIVSFHHHHHHHTLSSSLRSSLLTPLHSSSSFFPSLSVTTTITTSFPPFSTPKPSLLPISSSSSSPPPPPPSPSSVKKFSDAELLPLASGDLSAVPASPGVYAVFDPQAELQFVGISRRVSDSLRVHLQALPQLCASVKFAVVEGEERSALIDAWKQWLEEYIGETGKVPPGNQDDNDLWKSKPKKVKEDLKLTPGRHVQLNVPIEKLIDIVVKEKKVIAFIKGTRKTPQCGFSHRVLTALNEQGVEYDTMNVLDEEHNFGLREALKTYSNWPTFPQVFVNGELVGGADIIEEMAQSGELKALLQTST